MKRLRPLLFAALFLVLLVPTASAAQFNDIRSDHSLMPEISFLVANEIINGYPDGSFKPNAPIAKQHIAVMLVRALDLPTTNLENPGYKDVPTSHMYYTEIAAAYNAGLFSKADYFKPTSAISRGFMAKLLTEAFDLQQLPLRYGTDSYFTDVPTSHGYFDDIMTVTSNNIANGFVDGSFKPSQTITRAHFSGFLARAISLKPAAYYMPDPYYTYIYQNDDGSIDIMKFKEVYDETSTLWESINSGTDDVQTLYFEQTPFSFTYGLHGTERGYHFLLPTSVRLLSSSGDGGAPYRESVIATDASLTIGDEQYDDLILIEAYNPYEDAYYYLYFAEGIGLLAIENEDEEFIHYLLEMMIEE